MGTTDVALRAGNCQSGFSMVIEGYEYILCDAGAVNPVITAYAGTGWTRALPGLEVRGPIRERLEPWARSLSIPTVTVRVKQDRDDVFGKALFKSKPTYETRMTATFEPAADGSGTLTVQSAGAFPTEGTVYAGTRRVDYSAKSGTTFTVGAGGWGALQPFGADGANHFGEPVALPGGQNWDAAPPMRVTDVPQWIGRKVAIYIHRIVGGVWDTRAQARLEFAGRISGYSDDPNGFSVLELEDLRANVRDAVLLEDQWIGHIKKGFRLTEGIRLLAYEQYTSGGSGVSQTSGALTVVASGATGNDEIDEGTYELSEIVALIQRWLQNDGTLVGEWSCSTGNVAQSGFRTIVKAEFDAATSNQAIALYCTSTDLLAFLGWPEPANDGYINLDSTYKSADTLAASTATGDIALLVSHESPRIAMVMRDNRSAPASPLIENNYSIEIEASDGTWRNQADYLPGYLAAYPGTGESWGIVRIGGRLFLARYASATVLDNVVANIGPLGAFSTSHRADFEILADEGEDRLSVYQVAILEGTLASLVPMLFASVNGDGVNHATYDALPWGAAIPWDLLGDNFVDSAKELEASSTADSMVVVLHEPTRLMDIVLPELVLRGAWLMFKDGGYQFVTLTTPSALTADHEFTEDNKAGSTRTSGSLLSTTEVSAEWLRNFIKVEYHRSPDGEYQRTLSIRHATSIDSYGESALTISARSSYAYADQASKTIEAAAAALTVRVAPAFCKPLTIIRRTISPRLFHAVPGDTCTISDDTVRDPTSGVRGVSSRAGLVIEVARDYGHEGGELYGECAVLIVDEDRHYPVAPAAEIDTTYTGTLGGYTFTNGYASAGPAIKLKDHAYSRSTDALDATKWDAGDLVRIYRMDPTDPASPDAWDRTVSTVDEVNGILVLTATFSSPAYTSSSSERYRIVPQLYSAVQSSQKLAAFQADDSDGMILDAAAPNLYSEGRWYSAATTSLTDLPMLPPTETYGDGRPVHPGIGYDIGRLINNLVNYRTAVNLPLMLDAPRVANATTYFPVLCYLIEIGPRPATGTRYLKVAPFASSNNASGTASVRVTSSALPPTADTANGFCEFRGAKKQVTFTTASTSYAELTAQDLEPVRRPDGHTTYITVEMKISDAAYLARVYGLSRCFLGPVA